MRACGGGVSGLDNAGQLARSAGCLVAPRGIMVDGGRQGFGVERFSRHGPRRAR